MNYIHFFYGIAMATFGASGVFFFRLWKMSRDPFYLLFCISCFLLAIERITLLRISDVPMPPGLDGGFHDHAAWIYLIRLAAFLVIFAAIVHKNKTSSRRV